MVRYLPKPPHLLTMSFCGSRAYVGILYLATNFSSLYTEFTTITGETERDPRYRSLFAVRMSIDGDRLINAKRC